MIAAPVVVVLVLVVVGLLSGKDEEETAPAVSQEAAAPVQDQQAAQEKDEQEAMRTRALQIDTLIGRAQSSIQSGDYIAPEGLSALYYYSQALALAPEHVPLNQKVDEFIELLLRQADVDLDKYELSKAAGKVEALRTLRPNDSRLADFDAKIQQQTKAAVVIARRNIQDENPEEARRILQEVAAVQGVAADTLVDLYMGMAEQQDTQQVDALLQSMQASLEAGSLTAPPRDNAKYYLAQLNSMAPDDARVAAAREQLGRKLIERVDAEADKDNLPQAEAWLKELRLLNVLQAEVSQRTQLLNDRLTAQRQQLAEQNKQQRIRPIEEEFNRHFDNGQLIAPANNNALHSVRKLQDFAADDAVTQELALRLNEALQLVAFQYIEQDNLEQGRAYVQAALSLAASEEALAEAQRLQTVVRNLSALTLTRRVNPRYPKSAMRRGVGGWVQVAFKVNGEGETFDVRAINAEPEGVFDDAAVDAVEEWEYEIADSITDRANFSVEKGVVLRFALEE